MQMLEKLNAKLSEIQQGKANALKTIEAIDKQIASLGKQREQTVANLNAFAGAEQAVLQLIEEVSTNDTAEEVKSDENI